MNSTRFLLAGAMLATAPSATAAPVATYWMDVTTQSGLISASGQPNMADVMAMMNGGGGQPTYSMRLRLASKTPAPATPEAQHRVPPALRMGPSLPLVTPQQAAAEPVPHANIQGKLTIYWGCGDHVSSGQPLVMDLAQMASGKVPESIRRAATAMGRSRYSYSGPTSAPGFGEWPNTRDGRSVPAGASLIGPHTIEANYSPKIDFTLAQGQDFMAPMTLSEAGAAPSGAALVRWNPVAGATGYALAMFGANEAGETIMWSSASRSGFANLDYLTPGDAAKAVAAGDALSPQTTQCLVPAEVVRAVPVGMIMSVAYGPEVHFAEAPKNPKWAVTVRYNSRGSLMRGMVGMMGAEASAREEAPAPAPAPARRKRGLGLGDLLGALPR